MYNLTANFNRAYNPHTKLNVLSEVKRLLTSRDTFAQNKACDYLTSVINSRKIDSEDRARTVDYFLENDITVFLCEATSNLNYELFKSILSCLRLLWRCRRFFEEEHAAQAMGAVVRALAHYAGSGLKIAMETCLSFLDDLLNGISVNKTTSALAHDSVYSALQLLACLNSLPTHVNTDPTILVSCALVLHALVSYQPPGLIVQSSLANSVVEVLRKWYTLLMAALNHSVLVGDQRNIGMFFTVLCELSNDGVRFVMLLNRGKQKSDFVQNIIVDEQEINILKQCSVDLGTSIQQVLGELVVFTKENQKNISNDEYENFLKVILYFFNESENNLISTLQCTDFSVVMFSNGYLAMLPQVQILRNDQLVRNYSALVLGKMLNALANKYLNINETMDNTSANDINMGLKELQNGIEKPELIKAQFKNGQPYGLLIYIYFYCQSSDNPVETMGPLLPYLVEHVLRIPKSFNPPPYIIKALWLVFAVIFVLIFKMSTISNGSLKSLDERVYLEKATNRLVAMLHPDPSVYYTHNPAILLWAFTSQQIPRYVQIQVIIEWLKTGDSIPIELTNESVLWDILLKVLVITKDETVIENCVEALQCCLNSEDSDEFGVAVWAMLPNILPKVLIDCHSVGSNIRYILELASIEIPKRLDPMTLLKTSVLISAIYSKSELEFRDLDAQYHFEYISLKLCLCLLKISFEENDNRAILLDSVGIFCACVLLTYINRPGFMTRVLSATISADDDVACAALELLTCIVNYFNKNNYQPKSILQIQTDSIIRSLTQDSTNERGFLLLQLLYVIFNSGQNTPLALSYEFGNGPGVNQQCNALRALMFRIQMSLCCKESNPQPGIGWRTLNSIFKHGIEYHNDTKLVAILTSQPWTNILIQFQLSQKVTADFLTFAHYWLTLLKITLKCQDVKKIQISKYSIIGTTLIQIKNNLSVEEELKQNKEKTVEIAKEILDHFGIV